jgi:hypothetical protein
MVPAMLTGRGWNRGRGWEGGKTPTSFRFQHGLEFDFIETLGLGWLQNSLLWGKAISKHIKSLQIVDFQAFYFFYFPSIH